MIQVTKSFNLLKLRSSPTRARGIVNDDSAEAADLVAPSETRGAKAECRWVCGTELPVFSMFKQQLLNSLYVHVIQYS